ncbi:MAG: ATP-binding protein [Lachnospiraceae bacterium]|nr:ATP-binding protein [Lachnospiraceae bacterium]
MKGKVVDLRAFKKYAQERSRKNSFGLLFNAIMFVGLFGMDFLMRLFTDPESAHYPFLAYPLVGLILWLIWKTIIIKTPKVQDLYVALEYILGVSFACHLELVREDYGAFFVFFLVMVCCASTLLIQPLLVVLAQAVGSVMFYICTRIALGEVSVAGIISIVGTGIIGILLGFLCWFVRVQSMAFSNELNYIANAADERFVGDRNDYYDNVSDNDGVGLEKTISKRRKFTVIFNLTKEHLETVKDKNVFNLKPMMDWEDLTTRILRCAANAETYKSMEAFLNGERFSTEFKEGSYKRTASGIFNTYSGDRMWLNFEMSLRPHPVTGEVMCTLIVEDITNDRILIEIFKKLVINDYELLMCINRTKRNTVAYVASDSEVKCYAAGDYETEMVRYITGNVAEYDRERAIKNSHLRTITEKLREQDVYEFVMDECHDGEIYTKRVAYSYLTENKRTIILQLQDITDSVKKNNETKETLEKALEQARNANNVKVDFLSRMSHEMRTPMNAIMGLSNLLEDEADNPETLKEYVSKIKSSSDFLLQLINDVLDMAYLEDGKMNFSFEEISHAEMFKAVENLIAPMCREKNIEYINRTDVAAGTVIKADKLRLMQIFINLLDNAVKYTPKGGRVEFNCYDLGERNDRGFFRFIVKDNGVGMSEEFMKHLFEPFTQESSSNQQSLNGTGLGLPITKGLVEKYGGSLSVTSKKDMGSTFVVDLDFELVKEKTGSPQPAEADLGSLDEKRVLVVEDNEVNREIVDALLTKKGMMVENATNGQEALDKYEASEDYFYDAILMDIRMPVMSGIETTKQIRSMLRRDARSIPIIAMTANALSDDVALSNHSGMNEHLSKPINPQILYDTLLKCIAANNHEK